jgi:hypothetical protein
MGKVGTSLTGNPAHSCYEDFTFDKKKGCLSGASDDFMYDHVGVFSWTTEFWDVVAAATGHRASTHIWYVGPTVEENLAIARWADANAPDLYCAWRAFDHPQLGAVELGGPNYFRLVTNPPEHLLRKEVAPHADFAIYQVTLTCRQPRLPLFIASLIVDVLVCYRPCSLPSWRYYWPKPFMWAPILWTPQAKRSTYGV